LPAAVGGMLLIQKTISTGFAEPSPQGFGVAVTYAYVCTVHAGVCALVFGVKKTAVRDSAKSVVKIIDRIFCFLSIFYSPVFLINID
jgi:hypothetical protein